MSDTHAQTVAYVRDTMLPEADPPTAERGVIKWLRENLFSSWLNAILTILSLYVIYLALAAILPWASNYVWTARSLTDCREVFLVTGAVDGGGACWAVIRERWLQLLYGFYPSDQYWRPNLAFVLFFVAMAPVLFSEQLPRKMLIFTVIYPFLMPWLLWGGSFWTPILVLAGLAVGYAALVVIRPIAGNLAAIIAALLAAIVWWLWGVGAVDDALHRMVAKIRMDATLAQAEALPDTLRQQLDTLTEQRDALSAESAPIQAERQEAFDRIKTATDAAAEAARLEVLAEAGIDPDSEIALTTALKEELEHSVNVAQRDAALAPDFEADRAIVLETTRQLTEIKDRGLALSAEITRLTDRLSDARSLVSNIEALEANETRLAEIDETFADLRAAVPRALRKFSDVANVPDGTPDLDIEALQVYNDVRSERATLNATIDSTYAEVGRVGLRPVGSREFGGFLLALIIGLSGIILSLPLGIMLALGRQSHLFIINKVSVAFIEIIRGVPLIVWLFTAQLLLNYFLPPGTTFDLLLRVIIMVTLFSSAYIAEVVRGGLAALPKGQYEAGDALGLDYWKSMRLIVLPQALKISIPGIVNTFIGLFKDTTLVVFIGLADPIDFSNKIRATTDWNGIYWELFVFIGLIFFIFCYSMGRYSFYLEKKLTREHR
ncbi:MAG: general L-amino acid transport system permease protein [Rhodobacteraceae bacterium HLUCCA08]|nr:MAG: general L-amino acid transport system permease protein [Rhodobacteraceae bacterium HLUCCA08]